MVVVIGCGNTGSSSCCMVASGTAVVEVVVLVVVVVVVKEGLKVEQEVELKDKLYCYSILLVVHRNIQ